jgi:hypothetical protein
MKKYWIFAITGLLISVFSTGQVPYLMNYQAVLRDSVGNQLQNQPVDLRISIIKASMQGEVVFSEIHPVVTTDMGLINLKIGAGNALSGALNDVEWDSDVFFLDIAFDLEGSGTFQDLGTTQLVSVPYAFFAQTSAQSDDDWSITENALISKEGLNVAVGLDDPVEKLHVKGNIKTEDTLKFKGLTFPGYSESIPGQILIGPKDIKIGFAYDNLGNILIGNSHYGKTVFDLTMTGTGNVGIGTDVFHETTTASQNVCLGMYSGYNLSEGSRNIFVGSSAGEHIEIGMGNICLGEQSGNGRNGNGNIFCGNRAGYSWNGGGNDNIMLGRYAGYAWAAENSQNIFIGYGAGYEVSSSYNIFIGPKNTGRWSEGAKNIFLGYETGQNYTGSNTLLIDNKNDNTAPFIKGDMENDHLEINAQLTVEGVATADEINLKSLINLNELSTFPASPQEGDLIYMNDTIRFFTGTVWRNLW